MRVIPPRLVAHYDAAARQAARASRSRGDLVRTSDPVDTELLLCDAECSQGVALGGGV